jgi:hypothetical protein
MSAWESFSTRFAKRMAKYQVEFQKRLEKIEHERNENKKRRLKFLFWKKFSPIFAVVFFEELASISETKFDKMMMEIGEAINARLEELSKDYLDFELMMRDPITVLQEVSLTYEIWREVQKELEKHEELFEKPRLLLRLMTLMTICECSFEMTFAMLHPFFEALNMARKRLEIDENWAIATFALNLEELLVKKKLSELGVTKNEMEKRQFHELLERTIRLIETSEGRRLSSDVFLSAGYRQLRNKLYHEGYLWKPTRKEANQIVSHLLRLEKSLWG